MVLSRMAWMAVAFPDGSGCGIATGAEISGVYAIGLARGLIEGAGSRRGGFDGRILGSLADKSTFIDIAWSGFMTTSQSVFAVRERALVCCGIDLEAKHAIDV